MLASNPAAAGDSEAANPQAAARRMAHALVNGAGPLAAYPGPALIVGPGAVVLAANQLAQPLVGAIMAGMAELRPALESALAGLPAQLQPFLLPGSPGPVALDLIALPYADAKAALLLARDVTLERALRAALVDSRQRYKDLVEASSDFAWETGPDGSFAFVAPSGVLGYAAEDLVGRRPHELLIAAEGDASGFPFTAREPLAGAEVWVRTATGEPACLLAVVRPLLDAAGQWRGARGVCRDVTEARAREADLARARQRERLLAYILRTVRHEVDPRNMVAAAASIALAALAAEGCRIYRSAEDGSAAGAFLPLAEAGRPASPQEAALLAALGEGESLVERLGEEADALIAVATHHRQAPNGALCLWRPPGRPLWDEDDRFLLKELAEPLGVAIQQIADREALQTLSATDPLTGLMNRRSFLVELDRRFRAEATAGGRSGALFYVDLDNFKTVNDRRGHAEGDAALVAVARILRGATRARDLVARLGGDEFVLWLEDIGAAAACVKAEELLRAAGGLGGLSGDPDRPLALSIGIALHPAEAVDSAPEALLARADAAMYEAKRGGKARYALAAAAPPAGGAADAPAAAAAADGPA